MIYVNIHIHAFYDVLCNQNILGNEWNTMEYHGKSTPSKSHPKNGGYRMPLIHSNFHEQITLSIKHDMHGITGIWEWINHFVCHFFALLSAELFSFSASRFIQFYPVFFYYFCWFSWDFHIFSWDFPSNIRLTSVFWRDFPSTSAHGGLLEFFSDLDDSNHSENLGWAAATPNSHQDLKGTPDYTRFHEDSSTLESIGFTSFVQLLSPK